MWLRLSTGHVLPATGETMNEHARGVIDSRFFGLQAASSL
jgi:hypothetical protein